MQSTRSTLLSLALLSALGGCAGKGTGLDANGRPATGNGGGAITADFKSIQDTVFTPICTVCHAGGGAPQGLRLDSTNSYDLLVNVPSNEVPSLMRIKPGDPDNSYLVQKIEGHASVGAQMPLGGPPLSAEQISAIRQWVIDGAQSAAATTAPAAFKLVTTAPADEDLLELPPPQVMLGFNADLDLNRIDAGSLRLERIDATGAPSAVSARLASPAGNARTLLLTPSQPLAAGHYRVWLRTAEGLGLADTGGHPLLPAGRGTNAPDAAQALIIRFDVMGVP
ncbi:MAG: hypothetical protein U1F35_04210 [Steroidobacteraceae bacterium]